MPQFDTSYTFIPGDTVDQVKLNNIIDQATAQPELITGQTAITTIDPGSDYVLIFDASDPTNLKKTRPYDLLGSGAVTTLAFDTANPYPASVFTGNVVGAPNAKIQLGLNGQAANTVLAGPLSGVATTPAFRVLRPVDLAITEVPIAASDIGWHLGVSFTKSLTADWVPTFSFASSGQTIRVLVSNTANYNVTWPSSPSGVYWPNAVAPVMTHGSGRCDLYTFTYMAGHYWGTFQQNFLSV
jgi:hypothetical protein